MTAREETLARIQAALEGAGPVLPVPRDYRTRAELDPAATVALFAQRVADYHATVRTTDPDGLPSLVASLLASSGATRVVVPAGLPGEWVTDIAGSVEVVTDDGSMTVEDLESVDAVVTGCTVAIAETGTVVLDASPDQGRRVITLLPDRHVCVVAADRIVATVPEGLHRLDPTRPLTMISGPSATSDIELDRVEGVHGPRHLTVVIVT